MDRPFYRWCVLVCQVMVLNVLFVLTAWPVVTAPACLLALFTVFRHMADPDTEPTFTGLVRDYVRAIAADARSALTCTGAAVLVAANLWVLATHRPMLSPAFLVPATLLVDWLLTTTAVAAWFRLAPWVLLRTGFVVMLRNLVRGVPLIALGLLALYLELQAPFVLLSLGLVLPLWLFHRAHLAPLDDLVDHLVAPGTPGPVAGVGSGEHRP